MELTVYEQAVFNKLDTINGGKIPLDWPDRQKLIDAIKKYIDVWGTFEIKSDYTEFRRVQRLNKVEQELTKINQFYTL